MCDDEDIAVLRLAENSAAFWLPDTRRMEAAANVLNEPVDAGGHVFRRSVGNQASASATSARVREQGWGGGKHGPSFRKSARQLTLHRDTRQSRYPRPYLAQLPHVDLESRRL